MSLSCQQYRKYIRFICSNEELGTNILFKPLFLIETPFDCLNGSSLIKLMDHVLSVTLNIKQFSSKKFMFVCPMEYHQDIVFVFACENV